MTAVPRRTQWQPRARDNGLLGPQLQPAGILRPSQPPVIHVPNYMDHYSFTDPWGMDGRVGHVKGRLLSSIAIVMCFQTEKSPPEW